MSACAAVLFDLDGTLIDSAPDLAGALNRLRQQRGMDPLPYSALRPLVGSGARGMVGAGFNLQPGAEGFDELKDAFLAEYQGHLLDQTRVFEQSAWLLEALASRGLPWGIVTNKSTRYAEPVVQGLGLAQHSAVLVCGDTTPHAKPHPAPLLEAASRLRVAASDCVYVGDDLRDVQAGRAAGMRTVAVTWGYLGVGEAVHDWGADQVIETPQELLNWLNLA
ncbi:phosphoglycolate phosphatase [Ideonella sp. B508-1]|uniref:phosphoglycolate phosphatase n=1 Tax=Ideonella sp. B508-1 TaxID=137716 RepID=UPI0004771FFF|nr:phosphoglycolate phosphatase [Ideonella sp. B508-1]